MQLGAVWSSLKQIGATWCRLARVKELAENKSYLTVWQSSGACVATISLFSETSNEEFSNTCYGKPAIFEEL